LKTSVLKNTSIKKSALVSVVSFLI